MQQFLRMFMQGQNGGLPTFTSGTPGSDPRQAALSAALGMSGPIRKNMSGDVILPGTPGTGERSKLDSQTFGGLDAYHAMQRDGGAASRQRYQTPTFDSGGAMRPMVKEAPWARNPSTFDTRYQSLDREGNPVMKAVADPNEPRPNLMDPNRQRKMLDWMDSVNKVRQNRRRPGYFQ